MPPKLCRVRKRSSACQRWWPESFYKSGKFLQIRMIWKVSEWSEKCPDDLKSVWMIWKVSRWSEKCPNYLKSAQMICKVSGQSERCANDLGNVQMMHKMCFNWFYTFCQTEIQILSLIGLNYYWKFPFFWLWNSEQLFLRLIHFNLKNSNFEERKSNI